MSGSGIGSAISSVGPAVASGLTAPSLLNNPAGLADQLRLLGISSPAMAAGGESTAGMFGPSLLQKSELPLMAGGSFARSTNSPGLQMIGGGMQTLALLAPLLGGLL